jgi:hypothetical protein
MKIITEMDEQEMRFSLENLRPQVIWIWDIDRETILRSGDAIYVFLKYAPPHFIYLGLSRDVEERVFKQRRLRDTYSRVLIFRIEGYVDFELLREIEMRALRMAWKRWPWASWSNNRDLWVKGPDLYARPGHLDLMALVEKILQETEDHLEGVRTFDPAPFRPLPVTHQIGSPSSEIFAIGSSSRRGITVLKGSRLPRFVKSVADLRALDTPHAASALDYRRRGLLDCKTWTVTRVDGIYFTHDTFFSDWTAAASLVSLEDRPGSDWKSVQAKITDNGA